ncbi:hypothetical protein K8R43_01885 [archaeon]|nr:hypothetical protein [archaeon]
MNQKDIVTVVIVLVIILVFAYLGLFSFGPNWRSTLTFGEAATAGINKVSNKTGFGYIESSLVFSQKGTTVHVDGLAKVAEKTPGTVFFCAEVSYPQCSEFHLFPKDKFNVNSTNLEVLEDTEGTVFVYNDHDTFWIGFKEA